MTAVSDAVDDEPIIGLAPPGWGVGPALGTGGTALVCEVHRADHPIAVMKRGRWREEESHARFALEAEVLRAVGPPVTPAYIEHGVINRFPYLIMEHVSGETVAGWMSRNGNGGGLGEIVAILTRIAGALAGLHAKGFVHRDLKPENVLIGKSGIRLLDFGLVKQLRSNAPRLTKVGSVVGTPHYLSPEQIKTSSAVDHRADIYAFGVLAFEMLAGHPPFVGERKAIEYHHLASKPPSVSETRPIPPELDDIISACLAKQVESRPASAAALQIAISAALNANGTFRGVVATPKAKPEPAALGAQVPVALAWIQHSDLVVATRAIHEAQGFLVRQRGDGVLAAFCAQDHEAPLPTALEVCRQLIGEHRRITLHLTTGLVRRSAHGKPMVYGVDIEQLDRWVPTPPFSGIVLTASAAEASRGDATPAPEVPGFFRENRHDRTDANDERSEPPLVGRDQLIFSLIDRIRSAPSTLIGISGDAGSGKSRLLRVIAERLRAAGREVIHVCGRRRFFGDRPDDEQLQIAVDGPLEASLTAAAGRGAILIIDDVQWFSRSLRQLLLELSAPLARIVASPEPMFEVLDPTSARVAVELPRLSYPDAALLLRDLLRPARLIPEALLERLAIRGIGNPSILIALAHDLKRRGSVRRQFGGDDWYVAIDELDTLLAPPGPSWFASRIFEDLPPELSPVAKLCAALGPKFSAAEAFAATEVREIDPRLGQLVQLRILAERNGWYEFADPKLQEAIYDHVLDERELVHQRVLRHLIEARDQDTLGRLSRIAYHAAGAGERAISSACWTALARHAARSGDREHGDEILARLSAHLGSVLPESLRQAIATLDP